MSKCIRPFLGGVVLACLWMQIPLRAAAGDSPISLSELFPEGLLNTAGEPVAMDVLNDKIIGVYFSAKWCGPCRRFTPKLVEYREKYRDDFEVVFVSSDRSADEQRNYMESHEMKWPSVKWNSASATALKQKYHVTAIPTLVLLRGTGETLTRDGRSLVNEGLEPARLKQARVVQEKYTCGRCSKIHTREKLVFD